MILEGDRPDFAQHLEKVEVTMSHRCIQKSKKRGEYIKQNELRAKVFIIII